MTEDKRIEWCKKHCTDAVGNSYIGNLSFNDSEFIEIDTNNSIWLNLSFDQDKLPDFIKFKVKESYVRKVNIDLGKCPYLKSWQGLPDNNVDDVWLGSNLENIDHMPICNSINHVLIENQEEKHRTNKRFRIKQWQKFKPEVLNKIKEQNPDINISDYADGIDWLVIHDKYFYEKFLKEKIIFTDHKIILNDWASFESIINAPPIKIISDSMLFLNIDDNFNYSDGKKLMNNIFGKKELCLPNQEGSISEDDFLKLAEEKVMNDLTYSVPVRNNRKNK